MKNHLLIRRSKTRWLLNLVLAASFVTLATGCHTHGYYGGYYGGPIYSPGGFIVGGVHHGHHFGGHHSFGHSGFGHHGGHGH